MRTTAAVVSLLTCFALVMFDMHANSDAVLSEEEMSRVFGAQCFECGIIERSCTPDFWVATDNTCDWYGCTSTMNDCGTVDIPDPKKWTGVDWDEVDLGPIDPNGFVKQDRQINKLCHQDIVCALGEWHGDMWCKAPVISGTTYTKGLCMPEGDLGCQVCVEGSVTIGYSEVHDSYCHPCN